MTRTSDPWRDLIHGVISLTSAGAHLAISGDQARTSSDKRRDHFGVLVGQLIAHAATDAVIDWLEEGN